MRHLNIKNQLKMLQTKGFGFFNLVFGTVFSSMGDFISSKAIFIKGYFVKVLLSRTENLFLAYVYTNQHIIIRQRVKNINHLNHKL